VELLSFLRQKVNTLSVLFFGNSYGPVPYYGEEPYSGRRILEGIKAGEKENNK
jgi:hypothetical protein